LEDVRSVDTEDVGNDVGTDVGVEVMIEDGL
jgi:hypothetical protein